MAKFDPLSSSNFAYAGMSIITSNSSTLFDSDNWVIDSRVNYHMTRSFKKFSSYNPFSCKDKVCIVNGSPASISDKSLIQYTPTLYLTLVLHISQFFANLLYL